MIRKVRPMTITFTFLSTLKIYLQITKDFERVKIEFRENLWAGGDNGQVKVMHNLKIHLLGLFISYHHVMNIILFY